MIQYKKGNMTIFQSSIYMTTTAIIEGHESIIITDPCLLPNEVEEIKKYIHTIMNGRQLYIIYTHNDFDHIIGSGAFKEAKVIASHAFAHFPHKGEIIAEMKEFDNQYYLQREYKYHYPSVDYVITTDGEVLQFDSFKLTFYLAPGHTADSLFTVVEPSGIFLAGDYLSDVEFPFINSSYDDYISTIKKAEKILQTHSITTLVPGHGLATDSNIEIKARIHFAKQYLEELLYDENDWETYLQEKFIFYNGIKKIHKENQKIARLERGLDNI